MRLTDKMPVGMKIFLLKLSYLKKVLFLKKPNVLFIETTNFCNYDCLMCPRSNMKRSTGIMSMDTFRKIVDDASAMKIRKIHLQFYGEPLLNRNLPEMISYAKSKGIKDVWFDTTAYLLDDILSRKILESGLDGILFSVHGLNKEKYKEIHGVDGFEKIVNNIKHFAKLRDELDLKKPEIVIQCTKSRISLNDIDDIYNIFKGVPKSFSITECNWCSGHSKKNLSLVDKIIPRRVPCDSITRMLSVLWDGTVTLCCDDFDGIYGLGNIKEHSLKYFWKCKKARKLRTTHLFGKYKNLPMCRDCMDLIAIEDITKKFPNNRRHQ